MSKWMDATQDLKCLDNAGKYTAIRNINVRQGRQIFGPPRSSMWSPKEFWTSWNLGILSSFVLAGVYRAGSSPVSLFSSVPDRKHAMNYMYFKVPATQSSRLLSTYPARETVCFALCSPLAKINLTSMV